MAAPKIFGILFIILALGLALYFYRLDPIEKLGLDNVTLPKIFSTSTQIYEPPVYIPEPEEPTSTISPYPYDIPQGFTASQLSPYFGQVQVNWFTPILPESYGQVALSAYPSNDGKIAISGWYLKINKGSTLVISKGVDIYSPFGLQSEGAIQVKSGDIVNIYGGGANPLGVSFRLNKCLGYLEDVFDFTPTLYTNCPYIDRSDIFRFTGECQDYILSLSSCQLPDSSPPIPLNDYACRDYLSKLNYRGCFERYRTDPDFFQSEWRIWVESRLFLDLDIRHDRILLFDQKGLLVDEYSY